jgi:hypothetical protein
MKTAIRRLLPIIAAYCLASVGAGYVFALPFVWMSGFGDYSWMGLVIAGGVGLLAALPAACVIALAEVYRLRSVVFYGAAGGAVAAVLAGVFWLALQRGVATSAAEALLGLAVWLIYFAPSGLIGGLVYWRVAGRTAGVWRTPNEADGRAPA